MSISDEITLGMDEANNEYMEEYIKEGDPDTIRAITGLCEETCEMIIDRKVGTLFMFNKLYLTKGNDLIIH